MTYITKALSARRPIGTVLSVLALRQYISKMDGERIFAIAVFSGLPSAKNAVYSLVLLTAHVWGFARLVCAHQRQALMASG